MKFSQRMSRITWAVCAALLLPLAAQATKKSSGVQLHAEVPAKLRAGDLTRLKFQFSGVTASDGASVEVRDVQTRQVLFTARLQAGEQRTIELPYRVAHDGVQYVDVVTRQGQRSSVQSVAIAAGQGRVSLKPEGQRVVTPAGETLISLPAR